MLKHLQIDNFRCIARADLELHPEGTGIVGANASGKTSLLEAIYFLALGRSFRTSAREKLIAQSASQLQVVGRIDTPSGIQVCGVRYTPQSSTLRLSGRETTLSEVARLLPVQVIDPGVHRLVEEGSLRRRRLFDWGVFHVKHDYLDVYRRYQRALKQRNAALRSAMPTSCHVWDYELSAVAPTIDALRADYAETLATEFRVVCDHLFSEPAALEYRRGWPATTAFEVSLRDASARDLRMRSTTVGPHRADVIIKLEGTGARDRVSRGQQKLLACAFIISQLRVRARSTDIPTCLLLDDPAAELDVDNLGKLLGLIADLRVQIIVTSLRAEGLRGLQIGRMFHVEQGKFSEVI